MIRKGFYMINLSFNLNLQVDEKKAPNEEPHYSVFRGKQFLTRLYLDPVHVVPSDSISRLEMSAVQNYADYFKNTLIEKFNSQPIH